MCIDESLYYYYIIKCLVWRSYGNMVKIKIISNCMSIIKYWFDHRRVFFFTSNRFEHAYFFVFVPLIFLHCLRSFPRLYLKIKYIVITIITKSRILRTKIIVYTRCSILPNNIIIFCSTLCYI